MKLIGTEEEAHRLNGSRQEVTGKDGGDMIIKIIREWTHNKVTYPVNIPVVMGHEFCGVIEVAALKELMLSAREIRQVYYYM